MHLCCANCLLGCSPSSKACASLTSKTGLRRSRLPRLKITLPKTVARRHTSAKGPTHTLCLSSPPSTDNMPSPVEPPDDLDPLATPRPRSPTTRRRLDGDLDASLHLGRLPSHIAVARSAEHSPTPSITIRTSRTSRTSTTTGGGGGGGRSSKSRSPV